MTDLNYADHASALLAAELPDLTPELRRLYALLVLTLGTETTLQDVHDAWSLWQTQTEPGHRSLRPFAALAPEVQELDRPYMEAIHGTARKILEVAP